MTSLWLWIVTPPSCSWKILTHPASAKGLMPTRDRLNAGTVSASREVGGGSYGKSVLCWALQMTSSATAMIFLDSPRIGRPAAAASAGVMKLNVHTVSAMAVGIWWVAWRAWCAVRMVLDASFWWKCRVLVMGTWKCTWWAGLVRCAPVSWRLVKSLYVSPSGILVGGYVLYESGLRGGMGSLIDNVKVLLLSVLILSVSCYLWLSPGSAACHNILNAMPFSSNFFLSQWGLY